MRVEEAIGIARAPETVWARGRRPAQRPPVVSHGESVDVLSEHRWRVMHKPIPLRPHRLALRQDDAATVFNVEYRLEPTQTGTRLTQVSEFAWKRLPRVLHRAFGLAVRREVRGQLRTLKALLERDAPHDR
jgi:hypothetical protein